MYLLPLLMYYCVLSRCENIKLQNSDKYYNKHYGSRVLYEFRREFHKQGKDSLLVFENFLKFWNMEIF